jgi:hypothetical protein
MKQPVMPPMVWHREDVYGAASVVLLLGFLGVTLWLGWPKVSAWVLALF